MVLTVDDDVGHCFFRVQCAFPNMEGVAMLNTNKAVKYGKKSEKNRGMVLTTVGGDYGLVLFQGPVCISIYGRYGYAE